MWRTNGEGELYTYLPSYENPGFEANRILCNVAPSSYCNPTYGASVGRGAFDFKSGQWNTVSQRVRLNDVGQSNGELELFFNGKSVINVGGLKFRDNAQGRFHGLQAQTFFGGKLLTSLYLVMCVSHTSSRLEARIRLPKISECLVFRLLCRNHQDNLNDSVATHDLRQYLTTHALPLCMCHTVHSHKHTNTHYAAPYGLGLSIFFEDDF